MGNKYLSDEIIKTRKEELTALRNKIVALGLAGAVIGAGAVYAHNSNNDKVPECKPISDDYSNFDEYYKVIVQNNEAVKVYKAENVYILYDKETLEPHEYIFDYVLDDKYGGQLYDLETEEMLVYNGGITGTFAKNEDYYNYLVGNTYQVCLANSGDFIEGYSSEEYYSLEEIRELEPQILEGVKIVNGIDNEKAK